jgi:transcriptional regulator with XRE-family HTH domain
MSKAELARRIKVSRPTVDRLIKGGKCEHQMLLRIGDALDYPFTKDTFIINQEENHPTFNFILEPQNGDNFYGQFILEREKRIFWESHCLRMERELKNYKDQLEKVLKNRQ